MTFQEALNEVITKDVIAVRKTHSFDGRESGCNSPWSEWIRIRLDDDYIDHDAFVYFEDNNQDDVTKKWYLEWTDATLSRADIQAADWRIADENFNF